MKLVILRGLPGCGKSAIAEKLSEKLNSKVVYGDFFKRDFMNANSNFKNEDVYKYAHDEIFNEIKRYFDQKEKLVVIEELFNDKEFVEKIKNFCEENDIEIFWFYIQRDLKKLLEIENKRERKVKNTIEDFNNLQNNLDEIKNEGEVIIDNNGNLEDGINFILEEIII